MSGSKRYFQRKRYCLPVRPGLLACITLSVCTVHTMYFMNLMNRLLVKKVRCPKGVHTTRLVFEGQSQNRILGIV